MTSAQRLVQAQAGYQAGKNEEGIGLCRQMLIDEPKDSEALHLTGLIRHRQGKTEAAAELIRQAIPINEESPGYHCNTLPGEFMWGRVTQALYAKMGIVDYIAEAAEDYVCIAVELGTDKNKKAASKKKILAASDVLYEDVEAAAEWERFFVSAAQA